MRLIHSAGDLNGNHRKLCLAIGFFDGVHLGHQQIIRQTVSNARQHDAIALVITFDRHPNSVVAPDRVPSLIYSLPQKLRTIETLGPDSLLLVHFDKAFSEKTGEAFIRELARDPGRIQTICVGANFTFGHRRGGNVELLNRLGNELGFTVHGMAAVALDGQVISSTRIREAIRAGNFDGAGQMLGRPYALGGTVVEGDRIGRELGFPTANLDTTGLLLPPNGVYTARVLRNRQSCRAVVNIGVRPTMEHQRPHPRAEVHLLDFSGSLYGEELEVQFIRKLRDERKFASRDELRNQIARDLEQAGE